MNIRTISFILLLTFIYGETQAFCGFYVAKAGAELFNNKSQVIIVRDGSKSVITMSNDFSGNVNDFAMVVPVPTILKREDIRVVNQDLFNKFDSYSGPRLVEYYDNNPCYPSMNYEVAVAKDVSTRRVPTMNAENKEEKDYKVTIEASYAVGEYDILILSATESDGLKRWLTDNGYQIPEKAERVLEPYIKNNLKFFVVKVNTKAHSLQGSQKLRPLQISFESEKFMLPIRLGMANSKGEQDMIVYAFTKNGRIETANYRTLEIPTNRKVPVFVKTKFGQFYTDMFEKSHEIAGKNTVFLEYAWNVTPTWNGVKCDPCVGPPPINRDLVEAGVWWLNGNSGNQVFFTRLHVRYAEAQFPEDLFFLQTPNNSNFQGRYILTHPAGGDLTCDEGKKYVENLKVRRKQELSELAALTGWNTNKYTKYIGEGSDWVDEKKNQIPIVGLPNSGPPSTGFPWVIKFIILTLVSFICINYLFDLRKIYRQATD